MLAVAFDTLKLAKKPERDGMPAKQAESFPTSISESLTEWHSIGNLATKEDIQELKIVIKRDFEEFKTATKDDIGQLRTEMAANKAELLKWLFIAVGSQTLIQLVALVALTHGGK